MSASTSAKTRHPLVELVATLLAPFFIAVAQGDQTRAEALARQAVDCLQPTSLPEFLLAAQAVGFSLAAIAAIGQSATPDLPEKQSTSLRNQAERLSRTAARCQKALAPQPARQGPAPRQPAPPVPQPDALSRAAWAAAMQEVADEEAAESARYPSLDRPVPPIDAQQIAALRNAAHALIQPPPRQ